MPNHHYYCFSKTKEGEIEAYSRLPLADRKRFTRVFDFTAPQPRKGKAKGEVIYKPLAEHVNETMKKIHHESKTPEPFFLGFEEILAARGELDAIAAAKSALNLAENFNLHAFPVFTLEEIPLLDRELCARRPSKAIIRVPAEVLINEGPKRLTERLNGLCLSPDRVTLAVNLGSIEDMPGKHLALARQAMRIVPIPAEWANIVLCGSAFPSSLSSLTPFNVEHLPRQHWSIWLEILEMDIPRLPQFGDHGVTGPGKIAYKPGQTIVPKVRFPREEEWIVIKGKNPDLAPPNQTQELCQLLLESGCFEDDPLSSSHKEIKDCAAGVSGPGSPSDWIRRGTAIHVRVTIRRIASLS